MKIYICDDEAQIVHDFEAKIRSLYPESRISTFHSGEALSEALFEKEATEEACDVLLLDIDMPGMDGMDVARRLGDMKRKPLLVFVTSHDELVYDSFRYHPFGFVRKGYFEKEIEKVLRDCKEELESSAGHFSFRVNGKELRLLLSEIWYFEADANYLRLVTKSETYRIRSTITAVENSLSSYGFIRIHKGFLVNQRAIRMLGTDELQLENGTVLPVGKTYGETAKKLFMRYMRT